MSIEKTSDTVIQGVAAEIMRALSQHIPPRHPLDGVGEDQLAKIGADDVNRLKFGDRLELARVERLPKGTIVGMAAAAKTTRQTVATWIRGSEPETLTEENGKALADYLGVEYTWLMAGRGEMRAAESEAAKPETDAIRSQLREVRKNLRDADRLVENARRIIEDLTED